MILTPSLAVQMGKLRSPGGQGVATAHIQRGCRCTSHPHSRTLLYLKRDLGERPPFLHWYSGGRCGGVPTRKGAAGVRWPRPSQVSLTPKLPLKN